MTSHRLIHPRSSTTQGNVAIAQPTVELQYDAAGLLAASRALGLDPLSTDSLQIVVGSTVDEFEVIERQKWSREQLATRRNGGVKVHLRTALAGCGPLRLFLAQSGQSVRQEPRSQPGEHPGGRRYMSSPDHADHAYDFLHVDVPEPLREKLDLPEAKPYVSGADGPSSASRLQRRVGEILHKADMTLESSPLNAVLLVVGSAEMANAIRSCRPEIPVIDRSRRVDYADDGRLAMLAPSLISSRAGLKHAALEMAKRITEPFGRVHQPISAPRPARPARRHIASRYDVRIVLDTNTVGRYLESIVSALQGFGGSIGIYTTPTIRAEVNKVFGFDPADHPKVRMSSAPRDFRATEHGVHDRQIQLRGDAAIIAELGLLAKPDDGRRLVIVFMTTDVCVGAIAAHTAWSDTEMLAPYLTQTQLPYGYYLGENTVQNLIDRILEPFCS